MFDTSLIEIERNSSASLQRQIYDQFRDLILAGRLPANTRLPSSRQMAKDLKVSRNTVLQAYDQLTAEGFLVGRHGDGSYVANDLAIDDLGDGRFTRNKRNSSSPSCPSVLSKRGASLLQTRATGGPFQRAFRAGYPDERLFPFEVWGRLLARSWRQPYGELPMSNDPAGFPPLRHAIADYLRTMRGVRCDADQVVIVTGAQQAIMLATMALCDVGDQVAIEDPGYPGVRGAVEAAGVIPVPVPVDEEGLQINKVPVEAKLLCAAPSHQFPLGITMSLSRRLSLIDWAEQTSGWILEDDYDSEFRYRGRPLAALQGLDPNGRVIYIGSFSKVMFPSLRVGYMVVPSGLCEPLKRIRAALDGHPASAVQPALATFIDDGHFASHLRRMRKIYSERQNTFVQTAQSELKGILEIESAPAGMSLVAKLQNPLSDQDAVIRAKSVDIDIAAIGSYCHLPIKTAKIHLGYTATNEIEIHRGLKKLADALAA